jgi:CubicO group peptidase (beta-lactamase class C family)
MLKRITFLPLILAATGLTCANGKAQSTLAPALATKVDAAAAQVLQATGVPSASVAIVQDGKIAYLKAYGSARLDPEVAATPTMQYSVGSISKQFTASAIMLLVQQGKLSLDDPISKFLPDLTRAKDVTVRMVLSHTSGYQDYWPEDYVMVSMLQPTTAQHILDVWGKKPLDFEPGTKWQYSNTNYVIAGRIVEQLSGDSLVHLLQTNIFTPLGMSGVLNTDAARLPAGDPLGYYRHALGPLRPAPKEGAGWMFAAGELAMSAKDLALWNISIMNQSLLKAASYEEMFKPVMLKDGKSSGYGLGFFILDHNGVKAYEHSGEVSGLVSENIVYPQQKISITVLTNEDASSAAAGIARALAPMLIDATQTQSPAETQAMNILAGLQGGSIDRSLFTDYCNAYFTPEAIHDFATSLAPLGKPVSIRQVAEELRGGMTFHVFHVQFAAESKPNMVVITTYVEPDGKIEQYLVEPGT